MSDTISDLTSKISFNPNDLLKNIDWNNVLDISVKNAVEGIRKNYDKWATEDKELFEETLKLFTSEQIAAAVGPEEDKQRHLDNLGHLKNTLISLKGVQSIRTYKTVTSVIGRTLQDVLASTALGVFLK